MNSKIKTFLVGLVWLPLSVVLIPIMFIVVGIYRFGKAVEQSNK